MKQQMGPWLTRQRKQHHLQRLNGHGNHIWENTSSAFLKRQREQVRTASLLNCINSWGDDQYTTNKPSLCSAVLLVCRDTVQQGHSAPKTHICPESVTSHSKMLTHSVKEAVLFPMVAWCLTVNAIHFCAALNKGPLTYLGLQDIVQLICKQLNCRNFTASHWNLQCNKLTFTYELVVGK